LSVRPLTSSTGWRASSTMRQHSAAMAQVARLEFRSDSMGASHPFKVRIDGPRPVETRLCRARSIRKY
jgi:hypothetical protein